MGKLRESRGTILILGLATAGGFVGTNDGSGASLPQAPRDVAGILADRPPSRPDGPVGSGPRGPGLGGGPEQCRATEPRDAIARVRSVYVEAFNAGRIEEVAALHTEDVISMPAGMPAVEGRAALLDHMTASFEAAPEGFRFTFQATDLRIADGWAVERGVTGGDVEGSGGGIPAGKYVLLYERGSDGCWRIAWSITNSDRARRP